MDRYELKHNTVALMTYNTDLYFIGISLVFVCVPEQVVLDSSSSFPQSLSPSHSQRRGMQRLFLHLNLSVGHVCWSGEKKGHNE